MRKTMFRLLTATFCFCAGAGAQTVEQTAQVAPNQAESGHAFTVSVTGKTALCSPIFSRFEATLENGELHLTVMAENNPLAKCASEESPYTVDFRIPGLKAGAYGTYISLQSPCMYATPGCQTPSPPQYAGVLTVKDSADLPFKVSPKTADGGEPFELFLTGKNFTCADEFTGLGSEVRGHALYLSYTRRTLMGVGCIAMVKDYGPTFRIPALPQDVYQVFATGAPYCAADPCPVGLAAPQLAGELTVQPGKGGAKKRWYLKKKEVAADQAFTMQLLNDSVGNCQTAFSHASAAFSAGVSGGGAISAQFLVERHPERVCVQDVRPYGPGFEMQGLKAGVYPVFATELMACEVAEPPEPRCAVDRIAAEPVDTLIVAYYLSALLSEWRAQGPKVDLKGSRASFLLPEGASGVWRAEVLTLSGRSLSTASLQGEGGTRVEVEVGQRLPDRIYLLRLQGGNGGTRFLPIVRKE